MSDKDGGPAFPTSDSMVDQIIGGMTLRDYFAAKALLGLASGNFLRKENSVGTLYEALAKDAYLIADFMLKQRSLAP